MENGEGKYQSSQGHFPYAHYHHFEFVHPKDEYPYITKSKCGNVGEMEFDPANYCTF